MIETRSRTLLAIAMTLLAILGFDSMAIMVRLLLEQGYTAPELSAYRNTLGIVPSVIIILCMGAFKFNRQSIIIRRWRLALFRGVTVAVAQLAFYTALANLELATISALAQTNALFVVIMAVVMFKDRVGPWRIAALLIGFIGVLWVLRPGTDAFTPIALLPMVAAFCYGFSMVTVRYFPDEVPNALLYLYSSLASALGAFVLATFTTGFSPIAQTTDLVLIVTMSTAGGIAVLLLMFAYRIAASAVLAPFGYLGILTALGFGWLFFREAPIDTLFPGAILIVGAGVLIIWRENTHRKKASERDPPKSR
ncbi:MAG: DMT family transporter [Alphaproteobacteria bacterium]|jgi:drug/metabolite transporter (DMT)-like permease|nr:DMT family transporter [Alphaproteobacteria bacterium]MDG1415699.1 DMT family transporter [Alphaproteobacteria bacterium]